MSERVLTRRELNRALLARQMLLERVDLPLRHAVEALAGMQAQWAPAPTIGLWSRLAAVERDAIDRALARKQLVRATLMRATIHLVSTRDYLGFRPALDEALRRKWRQYRPREPDPPDLADLVARVSAAAAQPRTAAELQVEAEPDEDRFRWFIARTHAALVRTPDDRYVDAAAWVGRPFADAATGTQLLVRRYLTAFGPATAADVAAWSGLQAAELRPAFDAVRLRRFRDECGRVLLDVPAGALPPADTPAPPRLLPRFDNLILSHADRTRVIADDRRRRVIRAAEVDAVFLVDGFVAGKWKLVRGKKLALEPFGRLAASARRALEDEGEGLAAFLAG